MLLTQRSSSLTRGSPISTGVHPAHTPVVDERSWRGPGHLGGQCLRYIGNVLDSQRGILSDWDPPSGESVSSPGPSHWSLAWGHEMGALYLHPARYGDEGSGLAGI